MARAALTSDTTFYVRNDGNNANAGNADTSGGAWQTIQYALNYVAQQVDLCGYKATIYFSGNFAENLIIPQFMGMNGIGYTQVTVKGANTSQKICPASGVAIFSCVHSCPITFETCRIESTAAGGVGVFSDAGGIIALKGVIFGDCPGAFAVAAHASARVIFIESNWGIDGDSVTGFYAGHLGYIYTQPSLTCTLTSTPNFSYAFSAAQARGAINWHDTVFTGTAIGKRAEPNDGYIYRQNNGNLNVLPGNA